MAIEFRCPGCGKAMSAPENLAGKKVTCKACGQTGVKIPGTPASAPSPAIDLFGLDEGPASAPAKSAADDLFADAPPSRASAAPAEEALPTRSKMFEPMTAEKKQKLNKRADKINKEKASFAGASVGVSFGTIIAITLFGLRLYRIGHRATRGLEDDNRAGVAAPFEPAGFERPVNLDPKALAAEEDRDIARMLAEPGSAEAREWLDPAKHPDHTVFEMGNERARAMVAGFYERGAKRVSVVDADTIGNAVVTATIVVELPDEPEKRSGCFAWEGQSLGEEPTNDLGQKYLSISTD